MRRARGFTLLEILVAFTLLALLGGTLLQLFQGGLRNIDSSDKISHAALLARSKLAELQSVKALAIGQQSGRFNEEYHWRLELQPYTSENGKSLPPANLRALHATLDILWSNQGRYRVQTLLLSKDSTR